MFGIPFLPMRKDVDSRESENPFFCRKTDEKRFVGLDNCRVGHQVNLIGQLSAYAYYLHFVVFLLLTFASMLLYIRARSE